MSPERSGDGESERERHTAPTGVERFATLSPPPPHPESFSAFQRPDRPERSGDGESERALEPSAELLAACRGGDRGAMSELFVATRPYVYGIALRLARDEAGAADVTQEVYLKLLGRIGQFAGGSSFTTWLYRIVVSTALDQRRRLRPWLSFHAAPPAHAALASPALQERELLEREAASRLRGAVSRLPLRFRVPLVLRFVAGLSYREIAETLAISEGTVASRLSRALGRLGDDVRPGSEGASR